MSLANGNLLSVLSHTIVRCSCVKVKFGTCVFQRFMSIGGGFMWFHFFCFKFCLSLLGEIIVKMKVISYRRSNHSEVIHVAVDVIPRPPSMVAQACGRKQMHAVALSICNLATNFILVAEHDSEGNLCVVSPSKWGSISYYLHCPAAVMSVLECLKWQNFSQTAEDHISTEGKSGVPRFDGDPSKLAEYGFRLERRAWTRSN